jgi:hypothetical protein
VVAYKACPNDVVTLPNSTHGGPFPPSGGANASCTPAVPASDSLEVGTPDTPSNGAGANFIGSVVLRVQLNDPTPNDVLIGASITDVRCRPSTVVATPTVCNPDSPLPNTAAGPDYTGKLLVSIPTRITDHYNDDGLGNFTASGTVSDAAFEFSLPVTVPCAPTDDPGGDLVGSTCADSTSMNALVPGSVQTGNRANVQIPGPIDVLDGGPDGDVSTTPNTLFLEQGFFVP